MVSISKHLHAVTLYITNKSVFKYLESHSATFYCLVFSIKYPFQCDGITGHVS